MLQYSKTVSAARPSDLKLNNRRQILELFKFGTVHAVADLAQEVGVSRQTVMKSIQYFLEKGIIISDGKADSGSRGGKRAEIFRLSGDRCLLSLIVWSDELSITLINFRCETLDTRLLTDTGHLSAEDIVNLACETCKDMLEARGIGLSELCGLCVTASGIVGGDGTQRKSALFPGWGRRMSIAQAFRERLGKDLLVIEEDMGKVCGSALLHDLNAPGERVAAIVTFRDEISLCLISRGEIFTGIGNFAREFGHMIVASDDMEVCVCGSRGCLERQVSATRLKSLMAENAGRFPASPLSALEAMTVRDVFKASAAGDALAGWLSGCAARQYAHALRNLALVFDPDRVVLQGEYAHSDAVFREKLREELMTFKGFTRDDAPEMPFKLEADDRPLRTLASLGAYTLLIDRLFSEDLR